MARTTTAAVQQIIEVDLVSTPDLTPFIDTASLMVTQHCVTSTSTDEELELIERWLAAHFYAIKDTRAASESAGKVSESKQYAVRTGLSVTMYGQQAMRIDSSGGLAAFDAALEKGIGVDRSLSWIGTDDLLL